MSWSRCSWGVTAFITLGLSAMYPQLRAEGTTGAQQPPSALSVDATSVATDPNPSLEDYSEAYPSGKTRVKGVRTNGRPTGVWIAYYESGARMAEGEYVNGVKNGVWKYWHENGQIKREEGWGSGTLNQVKRPAAPYERPPTRIIEEKKGYLMRYLQVAGNGSPSRYPELRGILKRLSTDDLGTSENFAWLKHQVALAEEDYPAAEKRRGSAAAEQSRNAQIERAAFVRATGQILQAGTSGRLLAESDLVYITSTGHSYHLKGCQHLSKSSRPISLSAAKQKGRYLACKDCVSQ